MYDYDAPSDAIDVEAMMAEYGITDEEELWQRSPGPFLRGHYSQNGKPKGLPAATEAPHALWQPKQLPAPKDMQAEPSGGMMQSPQLNQVAVGAAAAAALLSACAFAADHVQIMLH